MSGCDFELKSFKVGSRGTVDYREKMARIFECEHGALKSKCMEPACVEAREHPPEPEPDPEPRCRKCGRLVTDNCEHVSPQE